LFVVRLAERAAEVVVVEDNPHDSAIRDYDLFDGVEGIVWPWLRYQSVIWGDGVVMRFWKWFWLRFMPHPLKVFPVCLGGVGVLGLIASFLPHHVRLMVASVVVFAALAMLLLSFLIWFVSGIRLVLPDETSTAAAVVIIVAWIVSPVVFLLLVATLASSGSMGSWFKSDAGWAVTLGEIACIQVVLFLLVIFPELLRRRLPWHRATKLARTLLPSWLTAAAAVITWIQIMLLHFSGQLPTTPLGALLVAGLGVAVLLTPLYQFISRSCWEYGIEAVLDPLRWHGAWRKVYDEVRSSFGSDAAARTSSSANARGAPPDASPHD
jgi:hypothetical protein